ncbi:MAG TPA: hypothetical protein VJM76_07760 [Gammaproteobacteria bacterium]|nr:hypothetical protein [Gammaproteobacteria bacterium]
MLHYFRQRRFSLGRSLVYLLATAWLALAVQPCVMAADSTNREHCPACPTSNEAVQGGTVAGSSDCMDAAQTAAPAMGVSCISAYHPEATQQTAITRGPITQPSFVLIVWQLPAQLTHKLSDSSTRLPDYANPPPLVRFCILQV